MWRRLLNALLPNRKSGSKRAGSETEFFVYRVEGPEGPMDVVSLVSHEVVFEFGMAGEAMVGIFTHPVTGPASMTADTFRPNKAFVELFHSVIETYGPQSRDLQTAAHRQGTGWVYVIDGRTPTPAGEVPARDIIGGFKVEDGLLVPGSYQANPNHQLFSADGLFKLEPGLHAGLMKRLTPEAKTP